MEKEHLKLLGLEAKDRVTGFRSVITSLSFDLYGCIQVIMTPVVEGNEGIKGGSWFDVTRVEVIGETPVMELPDFSKGYVSEGKKRGCDKPLT